MPMYCASCGGDFTLGNCQCEHWDFSTPIDSITVRASGETDDPWAMREFDSYTATIVFGEQEVTLDLCHRGEKQAPSKGFLKNLRRNEWVEVEADENEAVYEIPNPYYTAKFIRVPKKNCFEIVARAVTLDSEHPHRDCDSGGRARLTFGKESGEQLREKYADRLSPSSRGWRNSPWNHRVERNPRDWVYSDHSESDDPSDSSRSKIVPYADRDGQTNSEVA